MAVVIRKVLDSVFLARTGLSACALYSPWALRRTIGALRFRYVERTLPRVFVERSAVFVHVPKAAGHSISTALFGGVIGHRTLRDYESVASGGLGRFFVFSFVRNPWDRLYSSYCYLCRGGNGRPPDTGFGGMLAAAYPSFESFVHDFLTPRTIYSYYHFVPQAEFLVSRERACGADFVGRFERLEEDFAQVAQRLGCEGNLPRLNVSGAGDYRQAYSRAMWAKVGELYSVDCRMFGYTGRD